MFNQIQINGLFVNLIIYIILITPSLITCFFKKAFSSRKYFNNILIINIIITIFLSLIFYLFYESILNFLPFNQGVINYAIYAGKIIFISSSLYPLKYLIPVYFFNNKNKKASILLAFAKIIDTFICMFLGYLLFNTKGILFGIPFADIIYYLSYLYLYLKVFR